MRLRFRHNTLRFIIRYSVVFGRRINLGETMGTLRNDQSAFNLWVAYRKSRDRPPQINAQELVEAEAIIIDVCRFAASRVIPINFDENLHRPPNSNSNRLVRHQTHSRNTSGRSLNTSERYILIILTGRTWIRTIKRPCRSFGRI